MTTLFRPVYAVTRTKRRRILWCAWWTTPPTAEPFQPPDAWRGGARTEDEARQQAEKVAGMPLQRAENRWAGAWVRVRAGLAPFVVRRARITASQGNCSVSPYMRLGVEVGASLEAVKAAFRQKAREHHPDHGGDAADFIAVKQAYDAILIRRARRRR